MIVGKLLLKLFSRIPVIRAWRLKRAQRRALAQLKNFHTVERSPWHVASERGTFELGYMTRSQAIDKASQIGFVAYVDDHVKHIIVTTHERGMYV